MGSFKEKKLINRLECEFDCSKDEGMDGTRFFSALDWPIFCHYDFECRKRKKEGMKQQQGKRESCCEKSAVLRSKSSSGRNHLERPNKLLA